MTHMETHALLHHLRLNYMVTDDQLTLALLYDDFV
jgi:hypothetical protein